MMKKKTNKHASWKMTVVWAAVVITSALGFGIYQYKTAGWDFSVMSESLARVKTWVSEHKTKPHLEAKAKLPNKITAEQPLHFEFYTALPNMQLSTPDAITNTSVELKTETKTALHPLVKPDLVKTAVVKTNAIVTAEEVERELSGHLTVPHTKKEQFAIQLGVFKSPESAKHYQQTLQDAGFRVVVLPFGTDKKNLYRVQLGPYLDKNQANLTMHKLQAQGINGVIYKLK